MNLQDVPRVVSLASKLQETQDEDHEIVLQVKKLEEEETDPHQLLRRLSHDLHLNPVHIQQALDILHPSEETYLALQQELDVKPSGNRIREIIRSKLLECAVRHSHHGDLYVYGTDLLTLAQKYPTKKTIFGKQEYTTSTLAQVNAWQLSNTRITYYTKEALVILKPLIEWCQQSEYLTVSVYDETPVKSQLT